MRRDPRAYLADIIHACEALATFVADRDFEAYVGDLMLRSAVERQLEIIGEALNRLRQADAALAARIPDVAATVGFRNVLAHGYDVVDHDIVWRTVVADVPSLRQVAATILSELDEGSAP